MFLTFFTTFVHFSYVDVVLVMAFYLDLSFDLKCTILRIATFWRLAKSVSLGKLQKEKFILQDMLKLIFIGGC